jgi:hypothetical protein
MPRTFLNQLARIPHLRTKFARWLAVFIGCALLLGLYSDLNRAENAHDINPTSTTFRDPFVDSIIFDVGSPGTGRDDGIFPQATMEE